MRARKSSCRPPWGGSRLNRQSVGESLYGKTTWTVADVVVADPFSVGRGSGSRPSRQRKSPVCKSFRHRTDRRCSVGCVRRRRGTSRWVASTADVPAAYPRVVRTGDKKRLFAGAFSKPSDGLEPSTPSLPCAPRSNWWQPVAKDFACFRSLRGWRFAADCGRLQPLGSTKAPSLGTAGSQISCQRFRFGLLMSGAFL
jgi:hypothetical protein